MTTPIDIAAARKIIDAATPGPWEATNLGLILAPSSNSDYGIVGDCHRDDDAMFIVSARALLPAALDEIESLRRTVAERDTTIEELREALSTMRVACRSILNSITDSDDGRPGDGACFAYSGACEAADAILAKTATKTAPKEGK